MSKTITYELNDNVVKKLQDIVGGGGGIDISPLVVFKAGQKMVVDFSVGTYYFRTSDPCENNVYSNNITIYDEQTGDYSPYAVMLEENAGQNQLIASIGGYDYSQGYISVSNTVVIYEGDLSQLGGDTSTIASSLPTVEFTLDDDYVGMTVIEVSSDKSVTN